jgi:hypothetical protein
VSSNVDMAGRQAATFSQTPCLTCMPYGLIALVASIALTGVYVFVTDVAVRLKASFVGLLLVSLVWRYGLFLQAAISVCLSLYFTYLKARY